MLLLIVPMSVNMIGIHLQLVVHHKNPTSHFICEYFTITSSQLPTAGARGQNAGNNGIGLIEGNGPTWWGIPGVGYLELGENRPRLLNIESGKNIKIERIFFKDPPYNLM